jgi:integrase/recombinase XerD
LRIRHSKFGKSRLIPVASDLVSHLAHCQQIVQAHLRTCSPDTPFFAQATGRPYRRSALRHAFHQLLDRAGIPRVSGGRRLRGHDTRHSFAVLRLTLWYEQEVDLAVKLPLLATYLGHVDLVSSQRYVQLTQDLATEITKRHQARFGHLITDERSS